MEDIARGVRSFTIGTAISRVLGLVREVVFAALFGASRSTDAFNAAFRIPNLLRDLFAETALSQAFIPVLTNERQKGKKAQNLLASNIFNTLFVVVGAITVIGIIFSPQLANVVAIGFSKYPEKLALTGKLTAITFPFLLFVALAAWAMSYLNTEGSFFTPSLAPAFFNVFSILVPLGLFSYFVKRGGDPIYGAAIGVTAGGLLQFAVQIPRLFQKGFRYRFYLSFRDPEFRRVMVLFVPVAIGLAGSRINVAVNTVLVSYLKDGSMTWLNYAFRIMHLPLGLFGIAVGTVALPTLSRFAGENNVSAIRDTMTDSLKMVFFLTIPTSIAIAFLANPVTSIIYQHGRFTAADTAAVSQALILYIIGIPFISALRNVAAVFYAYKDARTPMYASFASIAVNLVLNITLMRVMGFLAFPLSTTIAAVVNIAILLLLVPRKIGRFDFGPLGKYAFTLAAASTAGGLGGWLLARLLFQPLGSSLWVKLAGVAVGGCAALALFYALCLLLGITEARDYARRFMRR
ncbi:MAG: murein biosynthesis integral membrane protein MurJ [Candidatus Krumholzibacteria bacterium]|nr:murein biosynthesis integral membrane protein MurJ [Candidatus Krumholzibacteria bacterium]